MWAALSPLVLWLAAIAAYAYEDGMNLFQWMGRFSQVLERPFAIGWTPYTLKCMLGSLLLYGCGIALYYSSRENRRPGEEYGSAKWGSPKELNRKYMDHQHKDANIILTQRVRLGMDGYITQRNMNVLVVGGSGSGKTRFFCKPNIYSANCSYLKALEPEEWHNEQEKARQLMPYKLPAKLVEYLKTGPLRLEFPERELVKWAELYPYMDLQEMTWKRKKLLSLMAKMDNYSDYLLLWSPRDKKLWYLDIEHKEFHPLAKWEEFIADPGKYLNGMIEGEFEE